MRDAVVRVRPPGESWMVIGRDVAPGVTPEDLVLAANTSGPDQATFTVKRDSTLPWRDLLPYGEIDVEVEGCGLVWGGRIQSAAPTESGWHVTCRGWQYHLDDDVTKRLYAHSRLSDWQDVRSWPTADNTWGNTMNPTTGPRMTFTAPGGQAQPNATAGGRSGLYLDGGYTGAIARVVIPWTASANSADFAAYLLESDTDPASTATYTMITNLAATSGTFTRTLAAPRRYVTVLVNNDTVSPITPSGIVVSWTSPGVMAFRAAGYESGGQSVLRASDVVRDAAGMCPLLSTDLSLVQTTGLIDAGARGIPHLTTENAYETPRQIMQRANAYHDWLLGVGADRRVYFRPRVATARAVLGGWSGTTFQDAGDQGDELYNRVIVDTTDQAGRPMQVVRTAVSPMLNLAGATRTKVLTAQAPLTVAAAQALADAWLARRTVRPARGSVTLPGAGALRTTDGADVTPAETLRWPGDRIRLADRWDPDTGGMGRDAEITQVTWTQATDTAQLTTDSPNDRLEVVLTRLAAIQSARPANY